MARLTRAPSLPSAASRLAKTHLDKVIERAERFTNETIVMMHASQLYRPDEVAKILDARVPPDLRKRIIPFVPDASQWPG